MTTLLNELDETETQVAFDGDLPEPGAFIAIGAEVLQVGGAVKSADYFPGRPVEASLWCKRGVSGVVSSHDAGAEVTIVKPTYTPSGQGSSLLLTDPGATWQPEHAYSEGDRILVLGSVVMESRDDGLSDAEEPEWEVGANVSDGEIGWRALGEVGQMPVTMMPLGLTQFAYTSPSALLAGVDPAMQFYIGQHDTDEAAYDGVGSLAATVTDHMVRPVLGEPVHSLYTGPDDPTELPGVAALMGSLYLRSAGDVGARLYVKVNPGDTSWQEVALV
jgi:hypothetical protein